MLLVEIVRDDGVLVTTSGDYGLVRLLAKPQLIETGTYDDSIYSSINVGDKLLVTHVKAYIVNGATHYFTTLKEVVAVL